MGERSCQKAAFTIILNYRDKQKPLRKQSTFSHKKTIKRARKLTMNAEEIPSQNNQLIQERQLHSANPQFQYSEPGHECQHSEHVYDELQQSIPIHLKDDELQMESPFCTRKYSEEMREEPPVTASRSHDNLTLW